MAEPAPRKHILFCTDFSEHAEAAFIHAVDQARKLSAKLHLLHVLLPLSPCDGKKAGRAGASGADENAERDQVQQRIGALKVKYGELLASAVPEHEFVVKVGSPDVEIVDYAERMRVEMIILGALGIPEKERVTRIRTAANVSKFAPCQVIVIQKNLSRRDLNGP